jgi:hypothetical protein
VVKVKRGKKAGKIANKATVTVTVTGHITIWCHYLASTSCRPF